MNSEQNTISTTITQANSNSNNFFIEVLKEGENFRNEISYFNKQPTAQTEFSNIQLKIIFDKLTNLKEKRFLRIDRISESNLKYFFESNLTMQFENVFVRSEAKFDFSHYIRKINSNKSFLFEMENEFNLNFFNGSKELHIFLDNYAAFAACSDVVAKLIGSGLIQSLEVIFKDKEADCYFATLERLLLGQEENEEGKKEKKNGNCVAQLILHNRLAEFKKENLEKFVNRLLISNAGFRVLKLVGFELSGNEEGIEGNNINNNNNDNQNENNNGENNNNNENANGNNNNQNLNSREAELLFDFDIEAILAANTKIKILSVAHDKKINLANEIDFFEKFYICRLKELEYEELACRHLAVLRKNFLPAASFFHKINGFIRKYLVKFFPVKSFEVKNDFASKFINYVDKDQELNILPDYVIAKIEKIGFNRSNIKNLEMEYFLEQVLGKEFN